MEKAMNIKPPSYLSTAAKRRFTQLAKRIEVPTETQVDLLGLLAQAWENYLLAQADLTENGINIISGRDATTRKKNGAIEVAYKERTQIIDLYHRLGLIPDNEAPEPKPLFSPISAIIDGE